MPYYMMPFNVTKESFDSIFGSAKIMYCASVVAYLLGSLSDIWLFGIIKKATKGTSQSTTSLFFYLPQHRHAQHFFVLSIEYLSILSPSVYCIYLHQLALRHNMSFLYRLLLLICNSNLYVLSHFPYHHHNGSHFSRMLLVVRFTRGDHNISQLAGAFAN